ncbi:MAG: hypothetical protein OEZ65_03520 [Gemmatimonadota bacterium]|nr:hypothetical protein [Gemmatimonadota bacterium]
MISTLSLQASAADLAAGATRDGLSIAADTAVVVMGVAVVLVSLVVIRLLLQVNGTLRELRETTRHHIGPISQRAAIISDNVEFVTQVVRGDVEHFHASLTALSDRLQQASDRMEERIEDFNALVEVVQGEAEEIFIDTASTVRGVREGARTITRPRSPRTGPRDGTDSAVGDP